MQHNKTLKVAIAGTSTVARYLVEELSAYGHDVVVLTRRLKPEETSFAQRETDYSVKSLVKVLEDRDALVSTVSDYTNPPASVKAHLDMLEACKQSDKCKTFIPSEWESNLEEYPEQPAFVVEANKMLHPKLKNEKSVKSTIICNSWFVDYINPQPNRYLRDIVGIWPMDYASKTFTIYGPGTQLLDVTSVRDVAKGVAALLASDEPWEEYTYMSGEQLTWNDIFALVKKKDGEWKSQTKPLADTIGQLIANASPEAVFQAQFEITGYAGALALPKAKVEKHRAKFFKGIHWRTAEEVLDAGRAQPGKIV